MSESAHVAITTVACVLVVVTIVGNSFVCLVIRRNRDMRNPIHFLLVNLAVADTMYAIFIALKIIFKLLVSHPDRVTGSVLCKFLTDGNIAWVGAASSILTLVVISVERYYTVMYPHSAKAKLTKRKLKVIIPSSWIFSLILHIPLFLVVNLDDESNSCVRIWHEKWRPKAYTLTWTALVTMSLSVMVGLYSRVVYTLWFKRDNNRQLTYQQKGVLGVRKRVTLMVITVSTIFGICWGTNEVVYTMVYFAPYSIREVPIAISNTMVLFNSAVNPFVYALLNQQFREKMKGMVCCTCPSSLRVQPNNEAQCIELAETTHPIHRTGPCSLE